MALSSPVNRDEWFSVRQVHQNVWWITEHHVLENQCNIWLVKGPQHDVVIDCGLGVCNLPGFLRRRGLIDADQAGGRECLVLLTHAHFDHSGGAADFPKVFIHEGDADDLRSARQVAVLNYVKAGHLSRQPPGHAGFTACRYRVRPTPCEALTHGQKVNLGEGHFLQVMHAPGHTPGSALFYYPQIKLLFSGDVVYECGSGSGLFDWLPTSSVRAYVRSASDLTDNFLSSSPQAVDRVLGGHGPVMSAPRAAQLLSQYVESRASRGCRCCVTSMQAATWAFFNCGCFRLCPC